jgi:acyl carrier protein
VVDTLSLRERVSRRLPDYMVPSAVMALDALPLTPNGKIDRLALPEPSGNGTRPYVPPRDEAERTVAGVWAEVLGVERVGVEDDFLDLGGDSLLAIRLMSRLRGVFEVDLSARAVFDARTVERLAELLGRDGMGHTDRIEPAPRDGVLPLSFAQQRLWFLEGFDPGGVEYYTGVGMRLRGFLDLGALRVALDALVARHEVLRTTFDEVDGRGVQIVHPTGELPLRQADLTQLPDTALDEVLRTEATTPFDLRQGPPARALLVRLADAEHVLVLSQHHIVTDGWSVRLLAEELDVLYTDAVAGRESRLAPPPVQYADFAVWNRDHAGDDQLDYCQLDSARLASVNEIVVIKSDGDPPRAPSALDHNNYSLTPY